VFLTIAFCHRWCGSQKQNCTPPKAFATLALPGELLDAIRRDCLERGPLKDAELGSAHALAAHEQPQGALGQDPQARRGWPHDSVVCPLTQTEALRRPPLAFLRASGRPRSCPSFLWALPLPVQIAPARSFGRVQGESRAPKSRARWPQSSRHQDPAHHLLGRPMLIYEEAALPVQPASCAPCRHCDAHLPSFGAAQAP
jgi:hypothetical protein